MKNYIRIKGSILISNKKSQAAMEFLMSYGWALLVILLVIAALAYFGMLNPDRFLPDKITVSDSRIQLISTSSNRILIKNVGGEALNNLKINMTNHNCVESEAMTIAPGEVKSLTLLCADVPTSNSRLKGDIKITYTANVYGEVVNKVVNANYAVRGNYFSNKGLVGYFPFDEDMNDHSGIIPAPTSSNEYYDATNQYSCTSNCAELANGKVNKALYLKLRPTDVECNYVNVNNLAVNTGNSAKNSVAFMMFWNGTDIHMPFGWGNQYDLWFGGGYFGFNTGQSEVRGVQSVNFNKQWTHVVAVFSNSPLTTSSNTLYINGVRQNIALCPTCNNPAPQSVTTMLRIGQWLADNGIIYCLKEGKIDEFYVFNRELTDEEAKALYMASR